MVLLLCPADCTGKGICVPSAQRPSPGKGKCARGKFLAEANSVRIPNTLLLLLLVVVACCSVSSSFPSSCTVAATAGCMGAPAEVAARQAATAGRPRRAACLATATAGCWSISAARQGQQTAQPRLIVPEQTQLKHHNTPQMQGLHVATCLVPLCPLSPLRMVPTPPSTLQLQLVSELPILSLAQLQDLHDATHVVPLSCPLPCPLFIPQSPT